MKTTLIRITYGERHVDESGYVYWEDNGLQTGTVMVSARTMDKEEILRRVSEEIDRMQKDMT